MEIFDGHRALLRPLVTPAIALGNFDGVHRGHQELLRRAIARARALGGDAVVYTFDPHPASVLAPSGAPPLLTSLARKLELFDAAGIDACILEPFTPELAQLSPDAFADVLGDVLGARHIVVGYDFSYGHKRGGTPETLRAFGARRGIGVDVVDRVTVGGEVASSTRIRDLLGGGDVAGAARLLGRPFDVDGVVVHGAGRGKTIGVPTANVRPLLAAPAAVLPASGVYAVTLLQLDADRHLAPRAGVANLGTNPTFVERGARSLEVHVLDAEPELELYDQRVRVAFIERIRAEQKFDGVDALVKQIRADIARAAEILRVADA